VSRRGVISLNKQVLEEALEAIKVLPVRTPAPVRPADYFKSFFDRGYDPLEGQRRQQEYDVACQRYNKSFCVLAAAEYFNNEHGVTRIAHFRKQFDIPTRITRARMENWIQGALLGHKLQRGKHTTDASRAWVLESKLSKNGIGPQMLELIKANYMLQLANAK